MKFELNKDHLEDIEYDIRPPLESAITLPVIIDGKDSGICIYVAVTAFRQGIAQSLIKTIAELLQVVK